VASHTFSQYCLFLPSQSPDQGFKPGHYWCWMHNQYVPIDDLPTITLRRGLCPECGYTWVLHGPWHPNVHPPAALGACSQFSANLPQGAT
jgi:hypothetical protein